MNYNIFIIVHLLLFSFCLCEISVEQKEKLLNGFIDYYNKLPNQIYTCNEGTLQNTQQVDETTYQIEATLKVTELHKVDVTKLLKCTATVENLDNGVTVTNNHCQEHGQQNPAEAGSQEQVLEAQVEASEPTVERNPLKLENEVQSETVITSGEQFIAIPRDQPSGPCIGCATHVNPKAAGVSDLANLGIRHLDIHEPSVKHSLDSVLDVQRQVQVVNGVRYILILSINFNNCSKEETENCASSKTCKITILAKPWVKLPNGANYRAILANNCTEEWQYGDNGEVLPELSTDNRVTNNIKGNTSVEHDDANDSDYDIQVKHNKEVHSQPSQERSLTDEEIKTLQEQIIPNSQFLPFTKTGRESVTTFPDTTDVSKQHVFKVESDKHSENSIPVTESGKIEQQTLNIHSDKKKAIDELLDFFDFSGFKPKSVVEEAIPRLKRSYEHDLQVMSLREDFHDIKKSIENAKFVYDMAQTMVDYLNEMDIEVKNRAVKNVLKAEEELENLQRFMYVQARVTIPCDKVECEPKDTVTQICNGVIDSTNKDSPQILNTFCYNDNKERDYREVVKDVSLDDPVLQNMAKEAVKKIESESTSPYALKINKIVSANTQTTSGTLSKVSLIIDHINCNKSVILPLRINCTVMEELGSKICEIIIHERHWLKEKKISYTCTDRPVDFRISKPKSILNKNIKVNDPKIIEMLQEAIQYLETQSNKNNKQKIVNVKSISTQIIAGFLTKIEFVVGYTNCTDENYPTHQLDKCELLKNDGLRICKAQIWDRSWIVDGRQVEVSCDDVATSNEIENTRKKRSIVGDPMNQSVNNRDLEYKKIANESLNKFLKSSSSRQHYKVIKVDRVAVVGKLIKMDFTISPTNCLIQSDGRPSSAECNVLNSKITYRCNSKILGQIWLDKKQYSVNCNTKDQERNGKTNLNGLKEQNPSEAKYYQLAEESLKKFLHDTGNSPHHRIVKVEKVTTQIVSGLLTSIDFIITSKNKTDSGNNTISCHSKVLEKHWLATKDFNVTCQMKVKEKNYSLTENPDNPKYMHIAVESLQKYIKNNPDSHLVRVTFVDRVAQVGGIIELDFMASRAEDDDGDSICHAKFSEQGLLRNDIDVKCYLLGTVFRKTEITEEDPNYLKYVPLAEESLKNYLQSINSSQLYTLINIDNITVQWDGGIHILIAFIVSPADLENTELLEKRCLTQILEQPWLNKKHIKVNCEEYKDLYRTKRHIFEKRYITGAPLEKDPTNHEYKVLAEECLRKYVLDSGTQQSLEVVSVEKVTTQLVAGLLTYIDFIVSSSPQTKTIKCHSQVWEQAWLKKKDIDVYCENDNQRGIRQIPGGHKTQDPTDPQYKALAVESLIKYVNDSGLQQVLEVVQVEKVTTQVVSGLLTHIDFTVSSGPESNIMKCHSKVWEQAWLQKKDIDVSCENDNQRGKRQVPGGHKTQDPTEPQYKALAVESLKTYVKDSGLQQALEVVQVEKVTTQVVSGLLTHIDFTVSSGPESNIMKCHSKVWEQAWLQKKDIDVSCENDNQRGKRQVPGGHKTQDPTEPQYKALAVESLKTYVKDSGLQQALEVVQVEKVTTQVVSGLLTHIDFTVSSGPESNIMKCHSKVWEQAWLQKKDIDVSCENDNQRGKRQVPGGHKTQDPTEPQYKALAVESLKTYVKDSGLQQALEVVQVEKVTTQVVSGLLTHIDFTVSSGPESNIMKCHSKVWEQAWLQKKDIDVSCENDNQRGKRQVPGGHKTQDPTEPQYKALAVESLKTYVKDSGLQQALEVVQVEKVTTQVVSGLLTHIDFTVSSVPESNIMKCHSKVWEQAWLQKKDIDVSCENDNQRGKRQVPGGHKTQDPTEPQYKALAVESLKTYVKDSGLQQALEVVKVEKVTTQVVSGLLTHIDFTVSSGPESNIMKCHSKVWEQAWLQKKDIDVSCENDNQRGKRQVPGGHKTQDSTEPQYKALAVESLKTYVKDSGLQQALEVVQVEKVTTQVVSGLLTHIDFTVSSGPESNIMKCHSKVWEQAWLQKKDIDVSCENDNQRGKRQVPGGHKTQDPTEPQYKALAVESLKTYVKDSGLQQALEVVQVEKVTTQVVSGLLTHIDFTVSSGPESNIMKCHSKVWEQAWLQKKDIDVSCENDNQRGKRQVPGGHKTQDPTEPQYKALAVESLKTYVKDSGLQQALEVVQVEKVTTQVVSGLLTHIDFTVSSGPESNIMKCHSKVWEQAWLQKKDIDVSCENDNQRGKRQVPGGHKTQDPTEPQYKALAVESLKTYVKDSGLQQALEVVQVEKVTTQVVSGLLTHIDFTVSSGPESNIMKCHSKVWEQAWLQKKDIDVSCENDNQRGKRQVPGGHKTQDPTEPQYKALAVESLKTYVKDSGLQQALEVVQVEKVTTQVVSGLLTHIDFTVSSGPESNIMKCHSKVWEQAWLQKKDIDVSCENDNQRGKRQVPGGHKTQDPTDPQYKALAVESLIKYVNDSGLQQVLEVLQVEKVTTQVVSGLLTHIDFTVSSGPESNIMKCHSKVWEQAWLQKKDIDVSCENDNQRGKRQVPGGHKTQDPTEPQYKALAVESLKKYVKDSGLQQALEVVQVEKVTTQVVSGLLTHIDFTVSSGPESNIMKCHSKVWEQAWLQKKDIDVSCENDNQIGKRQVPGGHKTQDPTDPQYKALAVESLIKYVNDSGLQQALKVVQVEKVTTQVVSGLLTHIDFIVSSGPDSNTVKCHSKVWEQAWLKKKDIDVYCENDNRRGKRQLPGGHKTQDPTDPQYKELAVESLIKYVNDSGSQQALKVVQIEKVTTQVVSGLLTHIDFIVSSGPDSNTVKCHSKVWEQAWLQKKDIDVSCQDANWSVKRQLNSEVTQDPTDPKYKVLAEESMKKYLEISDNSHSDKVVRVVKVTTQVVSGKKTSIDFTVALSDNRNKIILNCHSEIWEQVWLNKKDINVTCNNNAESSRIKRELVKGKSNQERQLHVGMLRGQSEEEQDPNKEEYKLLAEESLRKYQRKSTIYYKVVEVKRVVTRVVSGLKYKIDFSAVPTECSANVSNVHARSCKAKGTDVLYCHTDIWDRPWLKQKKIDIQCYGPDDNSFEEVESDVDAVDGSLKSTDLNNKYDKKYKLLAEEASEKYLTISNRKYVHKVTDIQSVSENISDGTITKIEYSISPTTCLRNETRGPNDICDVKQPLIILHCNAEIWDRPLLPLEKDIRVNCKKMSRSNKRKREAGVRNVRQTGDEDEAIEDDTTYYYADRAVQHVNDHSHSNNLHKLVTIHAVQNSVQMKTTMVRMYIELAETYCLRHHRSVNLPECEEMDGLDHRLCLARLWPSPDDELVVRHVSVVCDDDQDFASITALNIPELLRISVVALEKTSNNKFKLVHQGEPQVIPSLDSKIPIKINFIIATTNCSKDVNLNKNPFQCYVDTTIPSKACHSSIWLEAQTKTIRYLDAKCSSLTRSRRSLLDPTNIIKDNLEIQKLVTASLEKLEMSSLHRYKQRILQINSHSTKITSGKVTTIDFDVGYTSCLKYEWVQNITSCDFIEHLPRRRCVAQIWERLWISNGKNIDVNCVDDETPLESHIEFESAEMANQLAREALRHIEAKYPHPRKQTIVRIFSLEKQVVAGLHYRMKIEVGFTDCLALSEQTDCKLIRDLYMNKFCRVNVWVRPWTDHPPNFRVSCDYQEGATHDLYHHVQAEHLFNNFITTYNPSYTNDYSQLHKRFEIFKTNVKKIHEFNVYEKGTARYGVTRFTDLTYEEFRSRYMGLNTTLRDANQVPMKKADIPDINVPQNFDWREYNAVTEVKDQGSCGSCWAFSVTGNIEGQWKMQSGQLVSLSEQELVDCDKLDDGCNGGLPDNAYRAIEQLGGLELEVDYPYEADDEKCEFNKTLAKVQISGAVNITANETGMVQWLVHNGPISIGINANAMQFYMGGISHPWKMLCNPTNLDHGVLIVGYGVKEYPLFQKTLPYWIVKNSWGKSWGEQGYYRVYRGDGTCGVNQMASSAVI